MSMEGETDINHNVVKILNPYQIYFYSSSTGETTRTAQEKLMVKMYRGDGVEHFIKLNVIEKERRTFQFLNYFWQ